MPWNKRYSDLDSYPANSAPKCSNLWRKSTRLTLGTKLLHDLNIIDDLRKTSCLINSILIKPSNDKTTFVYILTASVSMIMVSACLRFYKLQFFFPPLLTLANMFLQCDYYNIAKLDYRNIAKLVVWTVFLYKTVVIH